MNQVTRDSVIQKYSVKSAFETVSEINAELDRLDSILGSLMTEFDEKKTKAQFWDTMAECNILTDDLMMGLYRLLTQYERKLFNS